MILGLVTTAWSWIRSSRVAQLALLAGAVLAAVFLYGRSKKRQGADEAVREAKDRAMKRMERSKEVHREINRLPLSERAKRLKELDG